MQPELQELVEHALSAGVAVYGLRAPPECGRWVASAAPAGIAIGHETRDGEVLVGSAQFADPTMLTEHVRLALAHAMTLEEDYPTDAAETQRSREWWHSWVQGTLREAERLAQDDASWETATVGCDEQRCDGWQARYGRQSGLYALVGECVVSVHSRVPRPQAVDLVRLSADEVRQIAAAEPARDDR